MRIVNGIFKYDVDEPILCLCMECEAPPKPGSLSGALSQANKMHRCTNPKCGRYWIFGQFTDTFASEGELERWLNDKNHEWQLEKSL